MEVAADGAIVFTEHAEEGRTGDGDILYAKIVMVQMRAIKTGLDVLMDGKAVVTVPAGDQITENQPPATAMGVHAVIGEIFCNDIVDNDIVMIEKNDSRLFVSSVKFLFRRLFPCRGPIVDAVFIPDGFPRLQILRLCLEMDGNHPAISIEEPWAQGPRLHMVRIEP